VRWTDDKKQRPSLSNTPQIGMEHGPPTTDTVA